MMTLLGYIQDTEFNFNKPHCILREKPYFRDLPQGGRKKMPRVESIIFQSASIHLLLVPGDAIKIRERQEYSGPLNS